MVLVSAFFHCYTSSVNRANTCSGWGVPFVWIAIWTALTIPWVRHDMHMETVTWEEDCNINPDIAKHRKEKQMHLEPTDSDRDMPKDSVSEPEP